MIDTIIVYLLVLNVVIAGMIGLILLLLPLVHRVFGAVAAYRLWLAIPITCVAILFMATVQSLDIERVPEPTFVQIKHEGDDDAPLHAVSPKRLPVTTETEIAASIQGQNFKAIFIIFWIIGGVLSLGLLAVRQFNLHRAIGILTHDGAGYYRSSNTVIGPMLVGVLSPKIIVPDDFDVRYSPDEQALILAHEQAHMRSGDHIVNAVAALFQSVNWFNPFIYIAHPKLMLDQEIACDARVLALKPQKKAAYMRALMKAQQVSYNSLLKVGWSPEGHHPLVARIKQLKRPQRGILSGAKRQIAGLGLLIVLGGAVFILSPFRIVDGFTRTALSTASEEEYRLIQMVKLGDTDGVQSLLSSGVDPDINIAPYGTPLIIAARMGDTALVDLLVKAGANVNYAARGQGFPLLAAIEGGSQEIVDYLLFLGARVNVRVPENDASPLVTAARLGETALVAALLGRNADPNMMVDDEGTALIAASAAGQIQVVDLLIQNGANAQQSAIVERRSGDGGRIYEPTTAFAEAGRANHKNLSDYLGRHEQAIRPASPP